MKTPQKIFILLCLLGICPQAALAESKITRDRFAYGQTILVQQPASFYEIYLPEIIYRHVYREDLGDVRVFNAKNEIVPHVIIRGQEQENRRQRMQAVNFYALYRERGADLQQIYTRVQTDQQGTIIELKAVNPETGQQPVTGYILDVNSVGGDISGLELEWSESPRNFIKTVSVFSSQDLRSWNLVAADLILAELNRQGAAVRKNKIKLDLVKTKYLYLAWPMGKDKVELQQARVEQVRIEQVTRIKWKSLPLAYTAGTTMQFASEGFFPVDRLQVKLPQDNTVVRVEIQSRPKVEAEWLGRYYGILYSLQSDGKKLVNDVIEVNRTTDCYWQILINDEVETIGQGQAVLELGYIQDKLLFSARGEGPFTMVYGNSRVLPNKNTIELFINEMEKNEKSKLVQEAHLGDEQVLAGPAALKTPLLPMNWREWMIWVIYLFILLVLAGIVRNLVREMNSKEVIK